MTTVTGEIAVLLDVLGRRQGDDRILDAVALVGPTMEVEEFDFDGEKSTYYIFKPAGTDLIFEDKVLVSAMVRTQPDPQDAAYGLYPRPTALVDGLSPTATRAEVTAFLGTPERVGPSFDRYQVNEHYLHFEFDQNGRTARITALFEPN
ncbi:hypothetical protein [Actinomadura sp. K4S16]|uniref:hypothetical protein n=1 Tax=Actinomadura sp. K4S16 TaxID=1316147 RepID=UPI0011EBA27F|nr:hypothetical protein [Actinomadura sp. K4S16]